MLHLYGSQIEFLNGILSTYDSALSGLFDHIAIVERQLLWMTKCRLKSLGAGSGELGGCGSYSNPVYHRLRNKNNVQR